MLDDRDEFVNSWQQAMESMAAGFGISVERMALIVAETRTEVQAMLAAQRLTSGNLIGFVKKFDDLMLTKYGLINKDRTPPER